MIGRHNEIADLERLYQSDKSEFVVVYGRRRVGKTFLIREVLGDRLTFYTTGLANADKKKQIYSFCSAMAQTFNSTFQPEKDWLSVFFQLSKEIQQLPTDNATGKKVIFFDEMPWMHTRKSDFLTGIEWFWNAWASARKDILLIVCGSATNWITNNLLKNRGGLYNRLTDRIFLSPFTLKECEEYYIEKGISMSRKEQLDAYMIFGGVPYYLSLLKKEFSLAQNVDDLCFAKNGKLKYEYNELYRSIFSNPDYHIKVIETLEHKSKGMNRLEIIQATQKPEGGSLTRVLDELEQCEFIRSYRGFKKNERSKMYQLTDFFSLFYFKFMKNQKNADEAYWTHIINTPTYNTWSGYAFEQVCFAHISQIKKTLGISGILTNTSSWNSVSSEHGAQIDMIIERADKVINICEIKFASEPYSISKSYDMELRHKMATFREETKTKKTLHLTMITPFGLHRNAYAGIAQSEAKMDDLFIS